MSDFGDFGGTGERPGHGYFAGQDRGRELARELKKIRKAKRPKRRRWFRRRKQQD